MVRQRKKSAAPARIVAIPYTPSPTPPPTNKRPNNRRKSLITYGKPQALKKTPAAWPDPVPFALQAQSQVQTKAKAGKPTMATSNTATGTTSKRRQPQHLFRQDLRNLLYACGDDLQPLESTITLLDELTTAFIVQSCHSAAALASAAHRTKVKVDDFKFVLRKSPRKLGRVQELLRLKREFDEARKIDGLEDPSAGNLPGDLADTDAGAAGTGRKRKNAAVKEESLGGGSESEDDFGGDEDGDAGTKKKKKKPKKAATSKKAKSVTGRSTKSS
jgi:transcription initiation factor TFIID subunit 13